ncbi:hypothetical protein ACLB2K_060168 [Fragaria x ananassa]
MDHGLLSVNTSTSWYEHAPFVLVIQAKQVFYLDDPKAGGEPLTSDIPDTSTIRINNDIHFPQGEYIPISGLGFDFGSLPYIPPIHDFINDKDEDLDEIPEDDLEDPDYDEDSD